MAEKTLIMLAKNMENKKLSFPLYMSEKIDGLAVNLTKMGGVVINLSRQNKPFQSIDHIMEEIGDLLEDGDKIVGELFIPGMDFKDSGGIIRRNAPDLRIRLGVYDHVRMKYRGDAFETRYLESERMMGSYSPRVGWLSLKPFAWITQIRCLHIDDIPVVEEVLQNASTQPTFEGWMYRSLSHQFHAGKRSWGMQRKTMKGSIDLRVVSVEEALEVKTKRPKGMVGRINVWYPHKDERGKHKDTCGVGPGRLTHDQRTRIWNNQNAFVGKIIEIEYKIDPSYNGLRQPTYQALRRDKHVGDNEEA